MLILRIKLLRNSLRNRPEIPNNTKNQNSEQKEIRIHYERSQQQKSNGNSENFLVNCVFIFAHDNNCLYWIDNKLFLLFYFLTKHVASYFIGLPLDVHEVVEDGMGQLGIREGDGGHVLLRPVHGSHADGRVT